MCKHKQCDLRDNINESLKVLGIMINTLFLIDKNRSHLLKAYQQDPAILEALTWYISSNLSNNSENYPGYPNA
jgi:hypothetical protein